jgi:glycosyltransferase involved in cell wall biosynthesis
VVASADCERGLELGIGNRDQYALVRSGIDVNAFGRPALSRDEMRASLGYAAEHIVVGTVACLKAQKAPLDFVRTAAGVCAENDRVRFFIAGDGPLRPQVKQLIDELGLQDKVVLLGWRRDVVELLHAMDIFLLTSLFEGLPRAILQAMAAGVAVVATAVDGTPEVVEDRATGLLIPAGAPSDAADRVLELAGDAHLRHALSDAARKRLSIEFEITQMVQTLEALYLEACDGARC